MSDPSGFTGKSDVGTTPPVVVSTSWSSDHLRAPFTVYDLVVTYHRNEGILKLPVAGPPGTPSKIVNYAAPFGHVVVRWRGRRAGLAPIPPDPRPPTGSYLILKHWDVSPAAPMIDADGQTPLHAVEGEAFYEVTIPRGMNDGFPIPVAPYDGAALTAYNLTADQFRQMLFSNGTVTGD